MKKPLLFVLLAAALVSFFAMADHHKNSDDRVLRHVVMFKFKDTSSQEDIQKVIDAFDTLPSKIDAIIGYERGINNSPEGLDNGFTHVFLLTFADEAGRAEYLPHPDHKAFGQVLRPHKDKVMVLDYWTEK